MDGANLGYYLSLTGIPMTTSLSYHQSPLTRGSLSPPTSPLTLPSFRLMALMVELSLSATNKVFNAPLGEMAKPDG